VTTKARVLVLDDDEIVLRSLVEFLKTEGHEARGARTVNEARSAIDGAPLDLILADVYLSDGTAFQLLEDVTESHPKLDVVLITGYGTIDDAIHAIKSGASDYITKPLVDSEIRLVIEKTMRRHHLKEETEDLRATAQGEFGLDHIVCEDPEMDKVVRMARTMANTQTTVIITGESGTGKTMLARAMHFASARADGPFVEVSCGALTESLLESELFGHEAGAFTGATQRKKGKFEAADGGTIFLDEVATASSSLQVKLLRLIQDSCLERVGGTETIRVDVRVILATNVDLAREVSEGRFREDLYYRINVVPIGIPPLRERPDDIPVLARRLIRKHAAEAERTAQDIAPAALDAMLRYDWPGNVRELENAVERAVLMCGDETVDVSDLPAELSQPAALPMPPETEGVRPLKEALRGPEREIIRRALEYARGNRDEAAKLLGINRSTLFYKMRKLRVAERAAAV